MPYIGNKKDYDEVLGKLKEMLSVKDEDRCMAELSYIFSYLLLHCFGGDVTGNFKAVGTLKITEHEFLEMFSHTLEDIEIRKKVGMKDLQKDEDDKRKIEIAKFFYNFTDKKRK